MNFIGYLNLSDALGLLGAILMLDNTLQLWNDQQIKGFRIYTLPFFVIWGLVSIHDHPVGFLLLLVSTIFWFLALWSVQDRNRDYIS